MTTNALSIEEQIQAFYLDIAKVDQQLAEFAVAREQFNKDMVEMNKIAKDVNTYLENVTSLCERLALLKADLEAIPMLKTNGVTLN